MQGRVITAGNRAGRSDPYIRQVQGSVHCRLRGKIPLQHPPRSKRSPHLSVSAIHITHGYARGLWPGSRSEDPHVVISPAQPKMPSVGSCQLAAPGRAGVGLYPIEASQPEFDSSTPPPWLMLSSVIRQMIRHSVRQLHGRFGDPPWSVPSFSRTCLLAAHCQDAGLMLCSPPCSAHRCFAAACCHHTAAPMLAKLLPHQPAAATKPAAVVARPAEYRADVSCFAGGTNLDK